MVSKKASPAAGGKRARTEADKLKQAGIIASRMNVTLMDPADLTLIREKDHPLYDPRVENEVDPADPFYKDILKNGVRDTVKVRKNGEDKAGRPILQVVDGRQRVMTLIHINTHHPLPSGPRRLKVEFIHGDDGVMVLTSLATNHQRKDETPYSRAVKIQKAKALGRSNEEIAEACRWLTTTPVEQHLLILNFVPEVQQAFNKELPVGAIKTFAKVPREEQIEALRKIREGGAKTKREVAAAVKASREGTAYVAPVGTATISTDRLRKMKEALSYELARHKSVNPSVVPADPFALTSLTASIALLDHLLGDEDALVGFDSIQRAITHAPTEAVA